jgi:hypothetical protein
MESDNWKACRYAAVLSNNWCGGTEESFTDYSRSDQELIRLLNLKYPVLPLRRTYYQSFIIIIIIIIILLLTSNNTFDYNGITTLVITI